MGHLTSILRQTRVRVDIIKKALGLIWAASGRWSVAWGIILVLQGLTPVFLVYLTKLLVDRVAAAVSAGVTWEVIWSVLLPALLMGALMVLQQALGSISRWINLAQSELVQDHLKLLIHRKAAAVHYSFYESSEYHDLLQQANSGASGRMLTLLQHFGGIIQSSIALVSIAVLLAQYGVLIPILLLVSTLPALYVVIVHNRRIHTWWSRNTELQRKASYYDTFLTLTGTAAEIRLLNIGRQLQESYRTLRTELRSERLRLEKLQTISVLTSGLAALAVTAVTMGWMVLRALRGMATLGDLALFYQAFNQGQAMLRTLMSGTGEVYSNTLFLTHLFTFLSHEEEVHHRQESVPFPPVLQKGITFEGVTFTYPGAGSPVFKDLDLHIPAGKIVAIVGENGAGKSTLIKLMCRLHDLDEGRILIDGIDLRRFDVVELRRNISIMFQHPVKYQETVRDNIAKGHEEMPQEAIEDAAQAAGAHDFIMRLPQGYDSLLGRMFKGGSELSGGQWQRIALARAYLRKAPLFILDEPTSFMDSWSEHEWLRRFRMLAAERTAILITHRFTTAMQADLIYVMMGGGLVEAGTHGELLERKGVYAASWNAQMQGHGGDTHAADVPIVPAGETVEYRKQVVYETSG